MDPASGTEGASTPEPSCAARLRESFLPPLKAKAIPESRYRWEELAPARSSRSNCELNVRRELCDSCLVDDRNLLAELLLDEGFFDSDLALRTHLGGWW